MKKRLSKVREQKVDYVSNDVEVTRKEFNLLTKAIRGLAQAQKNSEVRLTRLEQAIENSEKRLTRVEKIVEELAQAQKKSEERLTRLEKAIEELAEAQKKSEERLTRLEKVVEELAQAQKGFEERLTRLEKAVEELAQVQKRFEERLTRLEKAVEGLERAVEELARAQRRTEESLNRLAQTVEGLSDRIGFSLEDLGRELLPAYFKYHFGINVKDLIPKWFEVDNVRIEINFYGLGEKDGEEIILLGESQSRISASSIETFVDRFKKIESIIKKNTFRFAFGFSVHPSANEIADEENIKLIATYQLRNI